jgi:hypothetical protein
VDVFTWTLLCAVPVLYGLFWWLDYHWLARERERELPLERVADDPD